MDGTEESGLGWLTEALARAFHRGGAPSHDHARQLAENLVADPDALSHLGQALSVVARATDDWRKSEGILGQPAALRNVGAALEAIAFTRGVHHLDERLS